MKPTILFLFNSSDYAPDPWIRDGRFNVVSVDYDDTDHSGTTRQSAGNHTHLNIDLSNYDHLISHHIYLNLNNHPIKNLHQNRTNYLTLIILII